MLIILINNVRNAIRWLRMMISSLLKHWCQFNNKIMFGLLYTKLCKMLSYTVSSWREEGKGSGGRWGILSTPSYFRDYKHKLGHREGRWLVWAHRARKWRGWDSNLNSSLLLQAGALGGRWSPGMSSGAPHSPPASVALDLGWVTPLGGLAGTIFDTGTNESLMLWFPRMTFIQLSCYSPSASTSLWFHPTSKEKLISITVHFL